MMIEPFELHRTIEFLRSQLEEAVLRHGLKHPEVLARSNAFDQAVVAFYRRRSSSCFEQLSGRNRARIDRRARKDKFFVENN